MDLIAETTVSLMDKHSSIQSMNHFLFSTLNKDSELIVQYAPQVWGWKDFEDKEERRFRDDEQILKDDVNQYENEWEDEY